jgi:hypothetical protein
VFLLGELHASWKMHAGSEAMSEGLSRPRKWDHMKVLGIQLNAPSTVGLLRMLGFTLAVIALVEIADAMTKTVWTSEASLSFIVGAFSGFLLNECGASFSKHGWRAFALLVTCAVFVYALLGMTVW